MKGIYRDRFLTEPEFSQYKIHIDYSPKYNCYRHAIYGSGATAFFLPGYELSPGVPFVSKSNDVVDLLNRDCLWEKYIRGHIINAEFGGSPIVQNLVPLTNAANSTHKGIEGHVKTIIGNMFARLKDGKIHPFEMVLIYEVVVLVNGISGLPIGLNAEWKFYKFNDRTELTPASVAQKDYFLDKLALSSFKSSDGVTKVRNDK